MARKKFLDSFYLFNIKRHKEISEKVNGRHFAVVGPNGAGKTTMFQVIRRLLASLPDAEKPDIWLRQGTEEGSMRIILSNEGTQYAVEEKIKKGSRSRIKLWKIVGDKKDELTPAQERLKEIFGQVMDFTPLMDMGGEEQFEYLRRMLNIDVSGYQNLRGEYYNSRTLVGRQRDMAANALLDPENSVTASEKLGFTQEKKIEEVLAKRQDPLQVQNELRTATLATEQRLRLLQEAKQIDEQVEKLLQAKAAKLKTASDLAKIRPEPLREKLNLIEEENKKVDKEIVDVTDHNKTVDKVRRYLAKEEEKETADKKYQDYTAKINELDKTLNNTLASLPLSQFYPGLKLYYELKDDKKAQKIGLFLDDLPFNRAQLSYGSMIKCILKLSVYLNPEGLSFVYIGEWNLLDTSNQQDILKFAEENDNVQLGIEKVDDKTEVAIEFIDIT